ncbi:unnamed protein product, partial [Didymodactylos carnosus]
ETMDDLVLQILNSAKLFNGCTDEREQLKKNIMEKLAIETEVLSEHSTVWDLVYWHNEYSSRPDRLIKTLNEYMLLWRSDEQHRSESYQLVTPAVGSLISRRRPNDDEDNDVPVDASEPVRRFVESLFITHTEAKLNTFGQLLHEDDDNNDDTDDNIDRMSSEAIIADRGEWCRNVIHRSSPMTDASSRRQPSRFTLSFAQTTTTTATYLYD